MPSSSPPSPSGFRRSRASPTREACARRASSAGSRRCRASTKLASGPFSSRRSATSQKCSYDGSGPPVLRIPNIAKGSIDLTDLKFAIKPDDLGGAASLAPGDFLVIRTNGSRDLIGRAAAVREAFRTPHFFASYLIRFRIPSAELAEWVGAIWDAPEQRARIESIAATSAGQYNVNLATLSKLPVPIPPAAERSRILAELKRRFSFIEDAASSIDTTLRRADRLRQSILKRAFGASSFPRTQATSRRARSSRGLGPR